MKRILLILVIFSHSVWAQNHSDAFIIEVFDRYVKVLSPKDKLKNVSIVVLNKTLSPIYGKIATETKDLMFMSVHSQKSKMVSVNGEDYKNLMFIPLAPTFQEIDLVFGRKAYEIPEQK